MKHSKKRTVGAKTTTIQVHADLKDKLDLLKILTGKDDLNAVISEITEHFVTHSNIPIDKKMDRFIRRLKR